MMGLKEVGEKLPPGYKFYPSDEELVCHYLYKKIINEESTNCTLINIDLHSCEPWQLPEVAKLSASEWYFFTFRDRKYATGFRTNRATTSGYWKATGKDRPVFDPNTREIVGMRKTLVFYRNRAPNGIKTGWIMHEFRLECPPMPPKEDWVLCRVFHKSNRDTSITHMLELTGLSSILPLTNHNDIELSSQMSILPLSNNEEHLVGTTSQQQIQTSNYSISATNNSSNNNNDSSIIGNKVTNNIATTTTTQHNDLGNNNTYVIASRNNNNNNNNNQDNRNDNNLNDNMSSSSSSLNPSSDHHGFSISALMNDNEDDDEYGFLGSIDLLEGTSKFGSGVGFF